MRPGRSCLSKSSSGKGRASDQFGPLGDGAGQVRALRRRPARRRASPAGSATGRLRERPVRRLDRAAAARRRSSRRPSSRSLSRSAAVPASLGVQADALLRLEVGARPQPRDRRQVVGGDAGQRQLRELARRRRFEVEQPVREHPLFRQPLAHARLDGAQVLADDERLRALALERDDGQQLVGAASGRRCRPWRPSARGIQNRRNSPITWSMRRPPACRSIARMVSMNGR